MIGKNIAELRKRKGYTLSELSNLANISKSYLSNIERNINKNPSLDVMQKIASVLKVDLNTLLNTDAKYDIHQHIDKEWLEFVDTLRKLGLKKEQLDQYIILFEFINWSNQKDNLNKTIYCKDQLNKN